MVLYQSNISRVVLFLKALRTAEEQSRIHSLKDLLEDYKGDLRNLREEAGRDPKRERTLLKRLKGIGDVGVDIFFREVQAAWDELVPFADKRVMKAARQLGLGNNATDLHKMPSAPRGRSGSRCTPWHSGSPRSSRANPPPPR